MEKSFRDLLLLLRNNAQCYTFSDVSSKISSNFRQEIDRILKDIEPVELPTEECDCDTTTRVLSSDEYCKEILENGFTTKYTGEPKEQSLSDLKEYRRTHEVPNSLDISDHAKFEEIRCKKTNHSILGCTDETSLRDGESVLDKQLKKIEETFEKHERELEKLKIQTLGEARINGIKRGLDKCYPDPLYKISDI